MPDSSSSRVSLGRMQPLLCVFSVFTMATSVLPLSAQVLNNPYSPRFGMGHLPDATVVQNPTVESPLSDEERCFHWKLPKGRGAAVSAKSLNIPSKARREFDKACDASNKSKFQEAEQYARSAIEKFEDYPPAWVLLAISLKEQDKGPEARDACSRAAKIDANYSPAYLCAADVSTRNQEWGHVLEAANSALGLKSGGEAYAYYYRATAYLHMNNLVEARKDAHQAAQMDVNHDMTPFISSRRKYMRARATTLMLLPTSSSS